MNAPATHVRVVGLTLSERERERIRRTIARRLGRHARDIGRVSVRVLDENGPRGGVDMIVRVKVVLRHLPEVIVERRGARRTTVVDDALRAATQTVRRALARRRLEKLRMGWQMPAMEEVIAWRPGTPR